MRAETLIRALRLPFTGASSIPFVVGALLPKSSFRPGLFALGLGAVVCGHLAANLLNDAADAASGVDGFDTTWYGLFGGSKLIQEGVLSRTWYLKASALFLVISVGLVAALAAYWRYPAALAVMAGVAVLGWAYSAPPLKLSYRGLGEATVLLLFGPVPAAAGWFSQTGALPGPELVLAGLPTGLMAAAILVANEVPDRDDDRRAGKMTLVVRAGRGNGYLLFLLLAGLAYLAVVAGVGLGVLAPAALVSLCSVPLALKAAGVLRRQTGNKPALVTSGKLIIAAHAVVGFGLALGALL